MATKKIWIGEILYRVASAMRSDFGLSEDIMNTYQNAFKTIDQYFIQTHDGYYHPQANKACVNRMVDAYHNGRIENCKLRQIRKICLYMDQYYEYGKLTYTRFQRLGCKENNLYFTSIADFYVEVEKQRGSLSPQVITARRQIVCRFLRFLEDRKHQSFETVESHDIRSYLIELKKRQPKGIVFTLPIIRKFCAMLDEKAIIKQTWADILDVKPVAHKVIRTAFTKAETIRLLKAPDIKTPGGLRDYAMMLLAARTGLRSIDIMNLRFSNIDWHGNEITIIQHKTKKALSLPLFTDVGNAIAQYILNGRPQIESDFIFLSSRSPHTKLSTKSNSIVQRNMQKAGFSKCQQSRKGFHSFRRSIGTQMLAAEIPIEIISQVLGHSSIESTKPYLGIETIHLKECALDLSAFTCLRGELC